MSKTIRQITESIRRDTRDIVQELLCGGASEQQSRFCEMSIISQCFGPMLHLRRFKKASGTPPSGDPPIDFAVGDLADHITRFSLAGIRGIREGTRSAKSLRKKKEIKKSR